MRTDGVAATIGMNGRKREIERAVRPVTVHAMMTSAASSIAARQPAAVIAAVIPAGDAAPPATA